MGGTGAGCLSGIRSLASRSHSPGNQGHDQGCEVRLDGLCLSGNLISWLKSCGPHDRKSTESSKWMIDGLPNLLQICPLSIAMCKLHRFVNS